MQSSQIEDSKDLFHGCDVDRNAKRYASHGVQQAKQHLKVDYEEENTEEFVKIKSDIRQIRDTSLRKNRYSERQGSLDLFAEHTQNTGDKDQNKIILLYSKITIDDINYQINQYQINIKRVEEEYNLQYQIFKIQQNLNENNGQQFMIDNSITKIQIQCGKYDFIDVDFILIDKQQLNYQCGNRLILSYNYQLPNKYKFFIKNDKQKLYKVNLTLNDTCLFAKLINQNNKPMLISNYDSHAIEYQWQFSNNFKIKTKEATLRLTDELLTCNIKVVALYQNQKIESQELKIESLSKHILMQNIKESIESSTDANTTPIALEVVSQSNIVGEQNQFYIYFNYPPSKKTLYMLINEDQQKNFLYSDTQLQLKTNYDHDIMSFNYTSADIGFYSNLLVQDGEKSYLVPLHHSTIQPNKQVSKQIEQMQRSKLCIQCCQITLKAELQQIQLKQIEKKIVIQQGKTEITQLDGNTYTVIHPCVLFYAPREHPVTLNCQCQYDYLVGFDQYVTSQPTEFLLRSFRKQVQQKNNIQIQGQANYFLLLNVHNQLIILYFATQSHRDQAYTLLLFNNKQIQAVITSDETRKQQLGNLKNRNQHKFPLFNTPLFRFSKRTLDIYSIKSLRPCRLYIVAVHNDKLISCEQLDNQQTFKLSSKYTLCDIELHGFDYLGAENEIIIEQYKGTDQENVNQQLQNIQQKQIIIESVQIKASFKCCVGSVVLLEQGYFHVISIDCNLVAHLGKCRVDIAPNCTLNIKFQNQYYQLTIPEDFYEYCVAYFFN